MAPRVPGMAGGHRLAGTGRQHTLLVGCLPDTQERTNKKGENNMLKALLLLLMNLALAAMATAQANLVRNGSFEDTTSCDMSVIGIRKALHWYTANSATPDVWDADLDRECGYPLDPQGFPGWWYIAPYEGLRHAGAYHWFGPGSSNTRDYIMTRLTSPLSSGMAYEVSLAVALRGTMQFAVDHIGVWLGTDSLYEPDPDWLNVNPQLKLRDPEQQYLMETEAWTQLKDTLLATGGEEWLVVGNFDVADSVDGISAFPDAINPYAYYYIDSIAVRLVESHVSIIEVELDAHWWADGLYLRWSTQERIADVRVFDTQGRVVAMKAVVPGVREAKLHSTSLAPGLYIVEVSGPYARACKRIIKEEGGL